MRVLLTDRHDEQSNFYLHIAAGEVSMDKGRFSAAEGANNAQPDTENLTIINNHQLG
jgi:hypothetical protein